MYYALVIGLSVLSFMAGAVTTQVTKMDEWKERGREQAIMDVNLLLKSQWYYIRFRHSETGISMVFPAKHDRIRIDREHDVAAAEAYMGKEIKL